MAALSITEIISKCATKDVPCREANRRKKNERLCTENNTATEGSVGPQTECPVTSDINGEPDKEHRRNAKSSE